MPPATPMIFLPMLLGHLRGEHADEAAALRVA